MRTLLLAALLACSALIPATTQIADACGGYRNPQPAMFTVLSLSRQRSFVLLNDRMEPGTRRAQKWTRLALATYDDTSTSPAPAAAKAMTFTLVGPSGTKIIESKSRVWIDVAFHHADPRTAVPLSLAGDYRIAILGNFPDATWTTLQEVHGDHVNSYSAEGVNMTSSYDRGRSIPITTIAGSVFDGAPSGIVTINDVRYVALQTNDRVLPISF